jgi:hypothetical protein
MPSYSFSTTARNNMLDELTALIDAGTPPGTLVIYDGTPPADVGTALSGNTALATFTLNNPSSPAASGGVLTVDVDPDITVSASATGTATFFRIISQPGTAIIQGDITADGGGGALELDNTSITSGNDVTWQTLSITEGNA